jgi:hypothetical protein
VKEHANYHEYIRCIFSLYKYLKMGKTTHTVGFFYFYLTYLVLKFVNFLPDSSEKCSATPYIKSKKKHPGSRPGTTSRKWSMTLIHLAILLSSNQVNGSHGTFPATCARPASKMHFYKAYYSCSYYSAPN